MDLLHLHIYSYSQSRYKLVGIPRDLSVRRADDWGKKKGTRPLISDRDFWWQTNSMTSEILCWNPSGSSLKSVLPNNSLSGKYSDILIYLILLYFFFLAINHIQFHTEQENTFESHTSRKNVPFRDYVNRVCTFWAISLQQNSNSPNCDTNHFKLLISCQHKTL